MSHSKIPGHFEEQFQDTYGHPIQRGQLETPIKNHFTEA
jgi:hypothetical protein